MQASLVFLKIKQRLNKIDSSDYDNIECWQAREAYNKAQLEWTRRRIEGINQLQEGDEETKDVIDDIQILLKPLTLKGKTFPDYFESTKLPSDFLTIKRVTPLVIDKVCGDLLFSSKLREEENVNDYLADFAMQPAPELQETFHTLVSDKVRVYTNGDFEVDKIHLLYYRYPRELDFNQCEHIDGSMGKDTDPELKNDVVEIIIDEAAAILAGDTENANQVEITKQRSNTNT